MKRALGISPLLCALMLAGLTTSCVRAAEPFSPEQLSELSRLLVQHDACLRAEVRAQVKAEMAGSPPPDASACDLPGVASSKDAGPHVENAQSVGSAPVPFDLATPSGFFARTGQAPIDRDTDSGLSQFELTATSDASRASIKLRHDLSLGAPSASGPSTYSSLSLTLSAPLAKSDSGLTNIATLDGFVNAASLSVGYNRFLVHRIKPIRSDDGTQFDPGFVEVCNKAGIDVENGATCDFSAGAKGLAEHHRMDLFPQLKGYFFPSGPRWTYGGKSTIATQSDDYFDRTTLAALNEHSVPWSTGVYVGFVPSGSNTFFSLGADFQHAYKASKPQVVCPNSGSSQLHCVNGSIGPPQSINKRLVYVEGRSELWKTAVDLRLSHDFASGDSGVDLPIYLLRDPNNVWTGGLRLGWTNTDQFNLGIFVGAGFRLFP